jgi:hypothetical protein
MKGFSSKLIVALLCCLALLSFVSGQSTSNNEKSRSLRGINEVLQDKALNDAEEEKRVLKKVSSDKKFLI